MCVGHLSHVEVLLVLWLELCDTLEPGPAPPDPGILFESHARGTLSQRGAEAGERQRPARRSRPLGAGEAARRSRRVGAAGRECSCFARSKWHWPVLVIRSNMLSDSRGASGRSPKNHSQLQICSVQERLQLPCKVFPCRLPKGNTFFLSACRMEAKIELSLAAHRRFPFRGYDLS